MRPSTRHAIAAILAGTFAVVAVTAPVAARAPEQVSISSTMFINYPSPNTGSFETSGSDLICASGTVLDTLLLGDLSRTNYDLLVRKTFTCDSGGTIVVSLQVHARAGVEAFTWVILGGTGAYANLRGHGSGITTLFEGGAVNIYTGFLVG